MASSQRTSHGAAVSGFAVFIAVAAFSLVVHPPPAAAGAAPETPKAVLIVHADDPHLPWVAGITGGIYAAFEAAPPSQRPDVYTEHLDLARFPGPHRAEVQAAWLLEKYRGRRIDVIIAAQKKALDFLLPVAGELWPGVPIVLCENERVLRDVALPPGVTCVLARFDIEATLDLAKTMFSGTRRVAFVNGAAEAERSDTEAFRRDLEARADGLELIDLSVLSMAELEKRIGELPEDSIVFYWGIRVDGAGRSFVPREALKMIAPLSNRPIFGVSATMIGYGLLGGSVLDYKAVGAETGRTTLGILGGTPVAKAAPARPSFGVLTFDDRELRRWHIPPSRVPAGSQIRFREPSLWNDHRGSILAVAAALLVQGALIVALLVERRRHDRARALTGATLASLPSQMAVIDGSGAIVQVNKNWAAFGLTRGVSPAGGAAIGESYLEVWRRVRNPSDSSAERALDLLDAVLRGDLEHGFLEYPLRDPGGDHWFEMHVEVLRRPGRGAVVLQVDVTERHGADAEALQRQREIAHLNRVGAVGELASSLAHELNQPLAAILTNAQAARRLLARPSPDLEEVRASLNDIIEDDQRAGDLIHRMRSLLRKEQTPRSSVDLNGVVRQVLLLLAGDALLRRASVVPELAPVLPAIHGDSVQLKQVVLNLVVNGLDAVAERPPGERLVQVRTTSVDGTVELSVSDSGRGIAGGELQRVFEPFYTTKTEGLGMGLPICRSIVEAHFGKLLVESVPGEGATFRCVFPVDEAGAG